MGNAILNVMSIPENDLITPSSTQKYALGLEVKVDDSNGQQGAFVYVKSGGALTAKSAYIINGSGVAGSEVITAVPATSTVPKRCGVANVAFTSGYYGFLQVEGLVTITSAGATTAGNAGELANGVVTVTDSAAATEDTNTIGFIENTLGGAGDAIVNLLNKRVVV